MRFFPDRRRYYPPNYEEDDPVGLELRLKNCIHDLKYWIEEEGVDDHKFQLARAEIFTIASEELMKLIKEYPEHGLALTTGEEEIKAFCFSGSTKLLERHERLIPPRSEVMLKNAVRGAADESDRPQPKDFYSNEEVYAGDHYNWIPVSTLAKTLSQGGRLGIIYPPLYKTS